MVADAGRAGRCRVAAGRRAGVETVHVGLTRVAGRPDLPDEHLGIHVDLAAVTPD